MKPNHGGYSVFVYQGVSHPCDSCKTYCITFDGQIPRKRRRELLQTLKSYGLGEDSGVRGMIDALNAIERKRGPKKVDRLRLCFEVSEDDIETEKGFDADEFMRTHGAWVSEYD